VNGIYQKPGFKTPSSVAGFNCNFSLHDRHFRIWLEYFGKVKVFEKVTVAVNPAYTSQECSLCGEIVKKTLSTRTHACKCGCLMDRDENAARNILSRGLGTVGHTGTFATPLATTGGTSATQWLLNASNASGELTATLAGEILPLQVSS
jgi:putative transposase